MELNQNKKKVMNDQKKEQKMAQINLLTVSKANIRTGSV